MSGSKAIVVFAKPAVVGRVKTRLIPALGAEGACLLYRRLLSNTLAQVAQIEGVHRRLMLTRDGRDVDAEGLAADLGFKIAYQDGGDLGERMYRGFCDVLSSHRQALLIGCDSPPLTARVLRQAHRALAEGADVVLVPALDGGYVLMGLRTPCRDLFMEMAWGTYDVLSSTRSRIYTLGLLARELTPVWDVDRPEDLERLRATHPALLQGLTIRSGLRT